MMGRIGLYLASAALLSACSLLPSRTTTPSAPSPTRAPSPAPTRTEPPKPGTPTKAPGFQIAQCFSAGAPTVGISYPPGWDRRVSRAETQDELLGGSSKDLAQTDAFAKPVGAVSYVYPPAALSPPTEGICELKFDVSRKGAASNILAACSSSLFVDAATEAVKATRFEPIRVDGSPANGVNLTYDMKFCLAD